MMRFDWRPFLERWSVEWADAYDPERDGHRGGEECAAARWLGRQAANTAGIAAAESRLGVALPPSLRSFLAVTDGWHNAGTFVWRLAGCADLDWCGDPHGMREIWLDGTGDDAHEDLVRMAGTWSRSLQLATESDMVDVLLDPGDVDARGEWAVYTWAPWRASPPERHPSFRHFMEDMYRQFHAMASDRPGFSNDTTRALDERVERARLAALRGEYEAAREALCDAVAFGRPRASRLRAQIDALCGTATGAEAGGSLADPYIAHEAVPLSCRAEPPYGMHREESLTRPYPEADRPAVAETLRAIEEGTFQYWADGVFGEAVKTARALARRAEPEAAWRTLAASVHAWTPRSADHIAPVGLLADPYLGPVLTPERGRLLLSTPRGPGATGPAPHPVGAAPADGLGWLADESRHGFRIVLIADVEPSEVPQLLGAHDAIAVQPALTVGEAWQAEPGGEPWEARTVVRFGAAGEGWVFAHCGRGPDAAQERFESPAAQASRETRAVTVTYEPQGDTADTATFHLSYAEKGEPRFGVTCRGDSWKTTGVIPAALAPVALFTGRTVTEGLRGALDSIASYFGVTVSQEAVCHGRLDGVETRSWLREPAPGEGWAYWTRT
ncbi:SMI1/KNR4 family protein [Streptomyces virginiae]|uniref:SMI1/KNR4 family protein n=1 Tax=Streptomyces virginiae TaxID=1961 RepID=UPI0004CC1C6A|nr:SMI1/KNR4 family protein [Streptomyces virginiae]